MPNHVTHHVQIDGPAEKISAFQSAHFRDDAFDFQTIIPMPESLDDFNPNLDIINRASAAAGLVERPGGDDTRGLVNTIAHSNTLRDISTPASEYDLKSIIRALQNKIETSHFYWYDWCIAHWGTKWGAYSTSSVIVIGETHLAFRFDTAWAFPSPIFKKLAADYPELTFTVHCYDEGANFAGTGQFNGRNDFALCDATDEIYRKTFGREPCRDDDE